MIKYIELVALAVWGFQPDCVELAGDEGTLEDLEIVAGHVWNAVGGVDQGDVQVRQVDPKRFGVEIAPATGLTWLPGEEGDTKTSLLATLRPFKPMDLMMVERLNNGAGTVAVVTGLTDIDNIEVNGVNQFNSKNRCPSVVFGTVLSAPRPKIRFDTVQTSPSLSMDIVLIEGVVIAASNSVTVNPVFGGVAVKR